MVGTTLNIDAHELTLKDTDTCSVRSHMTGTYHKDMHAFGFTDLWLWSGVMTA